MIGTGRDAESDPIERAAWAFREALELGGLELSSLQYFPRGSCGDVCEMLGQYLLDLGLGRWLYRDGQVYPNRFSSHGWLKLDGLIVDITADQFAEVDDPVIVSRVSPWHRQITGGPGRRAASMKWFESNTQRTAAERDYALLAARAEPFRAPS